MDADPINRFLFESLERFLLEAESTGSYDKIEALNNTNLISTTLESVESWGRKIALNLTQKLTEVKIDDDLPKHDDHFGMNYLADCITQSEVVDSLLSQKKKELEEMKREIEENKEQAAFIKKILEDREIKGEIFELQGYTDEEVVELEKRAKVLFHKSRQQLNTVIAKLHTRDHGSIQDLLVLLTKQAFSSDGNMYVDLRSNECKRLTSAASHLNRAKLIEEDPTCIKLIRLNIID